MKGLPLLPAAALAARPPRLKTASSAYSFRESLAKGSLTYEDLVDMAVDSNVDGLDLTVYWFPQHGQEAFYRSLRRKACRNAVEIPSIAIRTNLCRQDARDQEREVARLKHWVDVADRLGASHIRVFGGNIPKGVSEDDAAGWVAEILKRSADYAASRGVIVGLENHGGITLYADRIISIVKAVDHPFVGVNLDTGNFRSKPYEQIAKCVQYAVNSQFKVDLRYEDGREEPCDWDRIVKMFFEGGYRGYMVLEYESKEDPFKAVPKHLGRLKELAGKYA